MKLMMINEYNIILCAWQHAHDQGPSHTSSVVVRPLPQDVTLPLAEHQSLQAGETYFYSSEILVKHFPFKGELLYARFVVPASSGSLTAVVSYNIFFVMLFLQWVVVSHRQKNVLADRLLWFRLQPHGLKTTWLPQFGFFSGITFSMFPWIVNNCKYS